MSVSLLERLEIKQPPKKNQPVEIIIKKGQVQIETTIVDKTDTGFDIKQLRQRLKNKELTKPKISEEAVTSVIQSSLVPSDKPQKIKARLTLPGEPSEHVSKTTKTTKTPKVPKTPEEEIILDIPATRN